MNVARPTTTRKTKSPKTGFDTFLAEFDLVISLIV
jgi:hypothetical protein